MPYCIECGHKLILKNEKHEGMVPYCENCHVYRYENFNTAVSLIVVHPDRNHILMIQQYHKKDNILVAGYVNKGERVEDALQREYMEEIGNRVVCWRYLRSEYYSRTNTLMLNFAVLSDRACLENVSDWEVDRAKWFTLEEARESVKPDSLAKKFLLRFLKDYETDQVNFFANEEQNKM